MKSRGFESPSTSYQRDIEGKNKKLSKNPLPEALEGNIENLNYQQPEAVPEYYRRALEGSNKKEKSTTNYYKFHD